MSDARYPANLIPVPLIKLSDEIDIELSLPKTAARASFILVNTNLFLRLKNDLPCEPIA